MPREAWRRLHRAGIHPLTEDLYPVRVFPRVAGNQSLEPPRSQSQDLTPKQGPGISVATPKCYSSQGLKDSTKAAAPGVHTAGSWAQEPCYSDGQHLSQLAGPGFQRWALELALAASHSPDQVCGVGCCGPMPWNRARHPGDARGVHPQADMPGQTLPVGALLPVPSPCR